jgi:hypothetical protein
VLRLSSKTGGVNDEKGKSGDSPIAAAKWRKPCCDERCKAS